MKRAGELNEDDVEAEMFKNRKARTAMYQAYVRKPLADEDLSKQLYELIQQCSANQQTKQGSNEVVKSVNRNTAEFVVIAGDVEPIEIVMHIPLCCEDRGVPYIWVESRASLGFAVKGHQTFNTSAVSVLVNDYSPLKSEIYSMRTLIDNMQGHD
mmetsp:Transcript_36013/g.56208  ORF Transcript_36013/g.56208 Transcript_36013/m.56208 type:complete len:155 (+) Transcript_36013:280-744(+)